MITDQSATLAEAIPRVRDGEDLQIRCNSHEDGTASLHLTRAQNGNVLMKCHAGCDNRDIMTNSGISWSELFAEDSTRAADNTWTPAGDASHVYPYISDTGQTLYEVCRIPLAGGGKTFRQRRPDAVDGRYIWNLDGVERVLYRLPQVLAAVKDGLTIFVAEGEKDVHSLLNVGEVATCNAQGAGPGKWLPQYTSALAGANVVICADADPAGRAHARAAREALLEQNCTVAIWEAPAPYNDVSELLGAGNALTEMLVVVPSEEIERKKFGVDILDVILRPRNATEWVIPGTLARNERLLITGPEGQGKSQLIRQIGLCVAAGVHPFSLRRIPKQKVLYIDAENEPGQTLENWNHLISLVNRITYGDSELERGQLIVLEEWDNADLDMADPQGHAWLHERINAYMPDLCLMGPLTNMVGQDLKNDEPVRRLKRAVNSARNICGTAFIMEHHAPHKNPTDKRRSMRPYGSSMFLKWPDYGFGLSPDAEGGVGEYDWEKTRWPRVRSRQWPERLRWGKPDTIELPWVEMEPRPQ